jgi:hypothetical protein
MSAIRIIRSSRSLAPFIAVAIALAACGGTDTTAPAGVPESFQLTGAQVGSLDSSAHTILQANPGNSELESLVDSTLLVFTAGVQAQHIAATTDLTSAPLYFVGIHRVVNQSANGSYSTWAVVGLDDPAHLSNILEVSGFAQSSSATAPTSVNAAIGSGLVNALMLQVGSGGAVTEWRMNAGSASFISDPAGAPCPNFTPTPRVTCAMETMHVHFTVSAANGSNGAAARQASIPADVAVPTMRLTITPP